MDHHIRYDTEQMELHLLDQRKLPLVEEDFICRTVEDVVEALQVMVVRGAPAIGVTAAYGCCLALLQSREDAQWGQALDSRLKYLKEARPTAVNLHWAVERMQQVRQKAGESTPEKLYEVWLKEARRIHSEDIAVNRAMGAHGAAVLEDGDRVMTHCNAGALATAGYGTALAVIRAAVEQGKKITVVANETRPFLQGARLTAYELAREDIPVTVACDNAAAYLMKLGKVNKIVVGADRIAANGDVANKIGTYGVALLARAHNVPFYVAAPLSTIDEQTPAGKDIPIEERPEREVSFVGDVQIVPADVKVYNIAFDITPAELVHGIITEKGILLPPYGQSIKEAKGLA